MEKHGDINPNYTPEAQPRHKCAEADRDAQERALSEGHLQTRLAKAAQTCRKDCPCDKQPG